MSVTTTTTQINWNTVHNMKRSNLEQNLVLFANRSAFLEDVLKEIVNKGNLRLAERDSGHYVYANAIGRFDQNMPKTTQYLKELEHD